jgi:hypothetical protein
MIDKRRRWSGAMAARGCRWEKVAGLDGCFGEWVRSALGDEISDEDKLE